MTRISDSPRHYSDTEFDALIASLSVIDLGGVPPILAPRTPPLPPTPRSPQTSLEFTDRLYEYHSPTRSGITRDWAEDSFSSQGLPQASARAIVKPRNSPRRKNLAYAVFYRQLPGFYLDWHVAKFQVTCVHGALCQGYPSVKEARAAYEYAQQRSWTGVRTSRPASPSSNSAISVLPSPVMSTSTTHNPLHGAAGTTMPKWHIVYAGITPGMYGSYLECAVNTLGLSCAAYDSAETQEEAQERWLRALRAGTVRVLTHSYYSV
ncbi:hypothetical protein DFH09DRAFT_1095587 [Mycena vulgaris]|nr:hypothetical protein DFH09DRAFT_1095587 [Mycena vulgaris]